MKSLLSKVLLWTIMLSMAAISPSFAAPIIAGYYPSYRIKYLPPEQIQFQYFNHVTQAFLPSTPDGKMSYNEKLDNLALVALAHENGSKALVSLGGGSNGRDFAAMVKNSTARWRYLGQVMTFVKKYGYDGVDIDWEYPRKGEEGALVQFVKDLHRVLKAWRPDAIMTIAVPAANWSGQFFDVPHLAPYIDYWNIMTYDFHGAWGHAGHLAALFPTSADTVDGNQYNLQYSLNYWLGKGAPRNRVLIGIPGYGRGFAAKTWGTKTDEQPLYKALSYREIIPLLDVGWTKYWDAEAQVPWLQLPGTDQRISYEDPTSVRAKARWAQAQGIAGVFFWEISQDYLNNDNYLVREAWRAFHPEP